MNETRNRISKILFCVILLAILIFIGYFIYLHTLTVVELNTINCNDLFGCTVAQFMDTELDCYDETGDLRKYAIIDQFGTGTFLRLSLPSKVCKRILNTDWIRAAEEIRTAPEISLSEGYKTVTVTVSAEQYDAFWDANEQTVQTVVSKAMFAQVLQGMEPGRIYVTLKLADADSGEVFDSETYYYAG